MTRVLTERPLMELRTFDLKTEKTMVENFVKFAEKSLAQFDSSLGVCF